jgi:hypothetical protein
VKLGVLIGLMLAGCAGETAQPGEPLPLAVHEAWTIMPRASDPFAGEEWDGPVCPEGGTTLEGGRTAWVLEIDTLVCNHVTLEQEAMVDIRRGDELYLLWWHLALTAPGVAEGHVALVVDGEIVYEQWIPIPAVEAAYEIRWRADRRVRAGAPIQLHVHNHGTNTWQFMEPTVTPR